MHSVRSTSHILLLIVALTGLSTTSVAQTRDPSRSVEEQLEELDQRVRVLSRLREIAAESLAALAPAPAVAASREGFALRSADGAFQIRFRGYLQSDARFFREAGATSATRSLLLRRIRPILEGTLYRRFDFQVMPDFASGAAVLFDAHSDVRIWPALAIRAGKFKPPLGLERLQSATDIRFIERGFPTNLVPNRDVGAQVSGDISAALVSYQAGVFNGVADLGNGDGDATNAKDIVARVFVQPLLRTGLATRVDLGVGIAASSGRDSGTAAAPALATYRTPGQAVVFRYRSGDSIANTVVATDKRTRLVPQGYVNVGRFGVLGEYAQSTQNVRLAANVAELTTKAWQVAGSWFLTGERASYRTVTPKTVFDPQAGTWGALELTARYGALTPDASAFPVFADSASSIKEETGWGVGVNWHFARNVKVVVNYERTTFVGGAAGGNRAPERLIVTRLQSAF